MPENIRKRFTEKYGGMPAVFKSPGRVNIIGEHTDYNEGFVLPGAINKYIYVAINKRADNIINLFAQNFNESFSGDIQNVRKSATGWANYILGVVDQFQKNGAVLSGFNLVIDGDIPLGSGLSSSAAVECCVAFALNEIFELQFDKIKMAHMSQVAEHKFPGVMCGIMDQFASMLGKKDYVIKLDCRSLDYEYIPFHFEGYKIVLLNSNVKHDLASSEYNVRRRQCEEGVALIKKSHPDVTSLRDVNMNMLTEYVKPVDEVIYKRCKYVVRENGRLLAACEDLKQGNIKSLGEKMYKSHLGLANDYEVSCKELDYLVDYVRQAPAVAGARMMGGGFGGCTINLVQENAIDKLVENIGNAYTSAMQLPLTVYIASIEDGSARYEV